MNAVGPAKLCMTELKQIIALAEKHGVEYKELP